MKVKRLPRWVKILLALVGALVALCLTLAVVTLLIMDNDDYRALAVWGTEHLAECRMVIDGTFEVEWSQTFSITATGLRFEPLPGDEGPSLTAVGRFHTRIALAPLLRGILVFRDLEIDNARLSHDVQDEPADEREPSRGGPFAFFTPIVERAALQNIQFHLTGNRTGLSENLVVHALTLESNRTGEPLGLQVDGRFNTDEFHIEGQLGVLYADLKTNRPFPIDLEISIADLQANVSGAIDHPFEGKGFNLKFAIEEQEVSNILRVFKFNSPPLGRFTLEAELAGDIETLRITDLDLKVSNGTTIQMSVEGSVPDLATGRGIDLQLSQEIRHYNVLQRIFPADWKVVETFRFKAALRNENGDYIVDDIDVLVANDKGIAITTNGRLRLGNPFGGSFLKAVDLKIHLTSPDTAGIKPLLTDAIPEIGAVQARARLVGPIDRLALEELFIDRGGSGPVQVTTRGRIGWIPLEEDLPLEDMDLTISIQAQRSKILREFYEVPIGEIGTVDLTGQIVGSSRRFKLQNVKLRSKTAEGLEALVTGGIDFVRGAVGPAIGDVGFK
ncbi:MAG: hypothetical protein JJV98_19220, partial [Desulfosarcina sp.]|nr:hypothetical protein [Desulfobacterales bacterium]